MYKRQLNARVAEINDYLENRLKAKVGESLAASGATNVEGLHKELKEKEALKTVSPWCCWVCQDVRVGAELA